TAADWVIVETEELVEVGELDPDLIMTPGALVDAIVNI
ncbi:MAG: branched-chain amino acid dehydrogenase, partial [Oscillospiraceae bacterium]|nr:branched-chain amino acid dehydrogenase [Oscillospiraceae bacterium]